MDNLSKHIELAIHLIQEHYGDTIILEPENHMENLFHSIHNPLGFPGVKIRITLNNVSQMTFLSEDLANEIVLLHEQEPIIEEVIQALFMHPNEDDHTIDF